MKTMIAMALGAVLTLGSTSVYAETIGDKSLFQLVEAGNPSNNPVQEVQVDLRGATGFTGTSDRESGIMGDPASNSQRAYR